MSLIAIELSDQQALRLAEICRLGRECHNYVSQIKQVHTQRMRATLAEHCANAEGELVQALTGDEWQGLEDLLAAKTAHLRPSTTNEEGDHETREQVKT